MIFTESTIKISNNVSKMDSTIVLYRGDKNVEIRFTILQSPFKYSNTVATNVIESTNASYGQLVIKTPNDKPPIFSEVSATKEGTVLFTITKEMIDEIEELGVYTFQIRLMDENKQSRVTIPPVENGIEIKEPIAIEDDNTTNVVGLAKANYAVVTSSDVDTPSFDDNGKYNKTNWNDGDIITSASLNKIEDGIYTTNENVTATKKYVDNGINYNNKQFNNRMVAMNISKHPVSCSTEIYKKPLCDIFPELLNITYNTVFRDSNSFKVNMDNFAKEYPTVKSAYNKLNINLYDENDNSIGNTYGNSINGDGLNVIFINITESLRFYAYFDKALVDGSSTTMETKNGYMTIQLLIPKDNNKQEFIDKIKNLKLTLSVIRTDFLNLNNETIYTPTEDYNPATKKYVDDKVTVKILPVDYNKNCATNVADLEPHSIYMSPNDAKFLYLAYEKLSGSLVGFLFTDKAHGRFIYTGAKDDTKIEIMMEGSCYTVYFKTDTVDGHVEKTVFYLTKNNTTEFIPSNDYEPATKKYVDDNTVIHPLPIYKMAEAPTMITYTVNIMDLKKLTTYGAIRDINSTKYQRYHFIYPCDDGTNKTIVNTGDDINDTTFRVYHYDNSSTLTFNNVRYSIDYTKHSTSTDIIVTEYIQNYLGIYNTREYTPTEDYHPATKKYVDDNKITYTVSSKVLATVPASDIKIDESITVSNVSINGDRRYYIEFLGSKKLCSLSINEEMGNAITCSINNYTIEVFNDLSNISMSVSKINKDDTTATTFTNLVIYEEEVKYLDNKYLETDLTLQNSISLGRIGDIGTGSSAIGYDVEASGYASHAEGSTTTASGVSSHAEGDYTTASGDCSHAEGYGTKASSHFQHVQGKYNIEDKDRKYAHIVGNGAGDAKRSNAHALDWKGNGWYAGKLSQEGTPTDDKDLATKKYVDDNILLEQLPILRIDETNKRIYINCNNMGTYKKYFVPNKYANVYGFSFIYTNEDSSETVIALVGGAMTRDDFILCARNTNTLFILILGGTDKYTYTKSTKTLEKGLYGYLKIGNTQEYTPTNEYNPATKKYVDDKVTSLPQLSFNEAGELVVTINGVSKTFVPKNV